MSYDSKAFQKLKAEIKEKYESQSILDKNLYTENIISIDDALTLIAHNRIRAWETDEPNVMGYIELSTNDGDTVLVEMKDMHKAQFFLNMLKTMYPDHEFPINTVTIDDVTKIDNYHEFINIVNSTTEEDDNELYVYDDGYVFAKMDSDGNYSFYLYEDEPTEEDINTIIMIRKDNIAVKYVD